MKKQLDDKARRIKSLQELRKALGNDAALMDLGQSRD